MSKGIVRAAERVAVWHEAAEDLPGPEPVTSSPPTGEAAPPTAGPQVSKSKKFTAPATALGKTLSQVPAPSNDELVTPHPAVAEHFQKYPDWTKSYVKPQYSDMLKAHLGDENYQKMLYHMPEEHHQALTTHQQIPAPSSKKFTGPANALKKLLEDPHTETDHVQQWLSQGQGAAFAKTYLQPGYADAVKGHLGEKNYSELQTHLNAPEKAQEKGSEVPDTAKAHGDALQIIKNYLVDQGIEDSPELDSYLNNLDTPTAHNLADGGYDPLDHYQEFGPKQQPDPNPHHQIGEDPEFQKWHTEQIDNTPGAWEGYTPEDQQNLIDQYQDQKSDKDTLAQAMTQHGFYTDVDDYKNWLGGLHPHTVKQFAQDPAAAKADFNAYLEDFYNDDGDHEDDWDEEGEDPWEPTDDTPQTLGDQAAQPSAVALQPGQEGLLNSWKKEHPDWQPPPPAGGALDPAQTKALAGAIQNIFPNAPLDYDNMSGEQLKENLDQWLKYLPDHPGFADHVPKLQAVHDMFFGDKGAQQQEGQGEQPNELDQFFNKHFGPDTNAIAEGIHAINPNFMLDKLKKTKPEDLQAVLKSQAKSHKGTPKGDQYQQLLDQHFGEGAGQQPAPGAFDADSLAKDYAQVFGIANPKTVDPQLEQPDTAEAFLKKQVEDWGDDPKGIQLQQIYDKHFGQQEQQQPEHTFNPAESWPNAGIWQHNEASLPPGFKTWAEDQGVPLSNYSPEEISGALGKGWANMSPEEKAGYAEQEKPEPSSQPFSSGIDNLDQKLFESEVPMPLMEGGWHAKAPYKWAPGAQAWLAEQGVTEPSDVNYSTLDSIFQQWEDMPADEKQHYIDQEGGAAPVQGDPFAWKDPQFLTWMGNAYGLNASKVKAIVDQSGPGGQYEQHGSIQAYLDDFNEKFNANLQWTPQPQQQTSEGEQGSAVDTNKPPLAWLKDHYKGNTEIQSWDQNKLDSWYEQHKGKDANYAPGALAAWMNDSYGDKDQWAQAATQAEQVSPSKPQFDWNNFGPEFKSVYPASAWANDVHDEAEAEAKLKASVEMAKANYPGTDKTKQAEALYQKYFGDGSAQGHEQGGGLDEFFKQFDDIPSKAPEPEPEPAKPFKAEPLNPDDLAHWAANKPQDAGQWKDFASWWGNTDTSPEDEQGLFKSWFGKDASPEQANEWFQSVFEHNSAPSEGDLSSTHVPNWAHNSWAFGLNADKEWPVFQAWAAKHPGIPKGTKIKQKVQIWKGLSDQDKSEIAADYGPDNQIDTKAVLGALSQAFPGSDWSKWKGMTPGQLAKNVQKLAEGGFSEAIPVFNQFFGGDMAMPEETPEGEEVPEETQAPAYSNPPVPPEQMPQWAKYQTGNGGQEFADYLKWAKSIGISDPTDNGGSVYSSPKAFQQWKQLSPYQRHLIGSMPQFPWTDSQGFDAWKNAQPTIKDEAKKVVPDYDFDQSYYWKYESNQPTGLKLLIGKETDPAKKQALLDIYQKHVGAGKPTLAQTLNEVDPQPKELKGQSWDAYLQSHDIDDVQKLLKKKLKNAPDPATFAGYVDAWGKYFGGTSGHKVVNGEIGKGQGSVTPQSLKDLAFWHSKGGNAYNNYAPGAPEDFDPGEYVKKQMTNQIKGVPAYMGWTAPGGAPSSFKGDPALYGEIGAHATYTAPKDEQNLGAQYKEMLQRADSYKPGLFSNKDKETLKSEGFVNWFNKAPSGYRNQMRDNPGVALDDYANFMSGGSPYPGGHGDASPKKDKFIDVSPFAMTPKKNTPGIPKAFTNNPPRGDFVKFPRYQDPQETLPLGEGERWAPKYAPLPIYRSLRLDLAHTPSTDKAPTWIQNKGPKAVGLWVQQQTQRLRRIDQILNGDAGNRSTSSEFQKLKNWGQKYNLTDKEVNDVAGVLFSEQSDLFHDDKWDHLVDFAKNQKAKTGKDIDITELHDLAKKLDVTPSAGSTGNYDHPELGQLILDYLENTNQKGGSESGIEGQGGLGWHWTRAINKAYKGVPDAGMGKDEMRPSSRFVPIALSGLWAGQGEGGSGSPDSGHGGAYQVNHQGELEHNLHSHAPVHVRRVQIRKPGPENQGFGTWHDTIDPGPISTWTPGRYEEGDEKHRSDYAPDPMQEYKPSLAKELTKELGASMPKDLDSLEPGHKADATFSELLQKYPSKKDAILRLYQEHFVGRPDLPTKPHTRRASVQSIPRLAALDERNPSHLYDLATSWGVKNPERYGIPYLSELARDLKGVGFATKSIVKQHGFGMGGYREPPVGTTAAIEDAIMRLAFDHDDPDDDYDYSDYEDDDDHEYDDEDFADPPEPSHDRPEGWTHRAPQMRRDDRGRQYFPPHGLNPPSNSPARPDIEWGHDGNPADWLSGPGGIVPGQQPEEGGQHQLFDYDPGYQPQWPPDRPPMPMYRGLALSLNEDQSGHDPLGAVRRALWGPKYELPPQEGAGGKVSPQTGDKALAQAHPQGFDNPNLGSAILNHVKNNPKTYENQKGYGLGPHWSIDPGTAHSFAQESTGGGSNPLKLPVVMRAQWKGLGEDPYRVHTMGDYPEEGEVTMLPGAKMHVDSVKVKHPHTGQWHEVLDQPQQHHASMRDELGAFPQVALQSRRSAPTMTLRRPRGILTMKERIQ